MKPYNGIWPVAPTPFYPDGSIDKEGMCRVLDLMIAQGVDGICILANYSEQFLLSDAERDMLMRLCVEHIDGRIPIIVTISHFATDIVEQRAKYAKELGADIVMMMVPYHGALLQGSDTQTYEQFMRVSDIGIPIMLQDAPLSGVSLSVELLTKMAKEIEMLKLFKIESIRTADKIRALLDAADEYIDGPFDGEEGITLFPDLEAGASGSMTSALIPDKIKPVISAHLAGNRAKAKDIYQEVLPIINYENRQCGFQAAKIALAHSGIISSDFCRHPIAELHPNTKKTLIELITPLDPIILNY